MFIIDFIKLRALQIMFGTLATVMLIDIIQNGIFSYVYFWISYVPHAYKVLIYSVMVILFKQSYGNIKTILFFGLFTSFVEITYAIPYYFIFHSQWILILLHYFPFYIFCIIFATTYYLLKPKWIWPDKRNWFKYVPLSVITVLTLWAFATGLYVDNSLQVNLREFIDNLMLYPVLKWFIHI